MNNSFYMLTGPIRKGLLQLLRNLASLDAGFVVFADADVGWIDEGAGWTVVVIADMGVMMVFADAGAGWTTASARWVGDAEALTLAMKATLRGREAGVLSCKPQVPFLLIFNGSEQDPWVYIHRPDEIL